MSCKIKLETALEAIKTGDVKLLENLPKFNRVLTRYVVHHKQIEKRMDGSSGGAYSAILETLTKEGYYYTGTRFDENLHLRHVITNNPEEIPLIVGHKPVASDCSDVFVQILDLLEKKERVLFCGTPLQCAALKCMVGDNDNLITVDIICTPFACQELLDKYAIELGIKYKAQVRDIRFYDREFTYTQSKRITLSNGRTEYIYKQDLFDTLAQSDKFTNRDNSREVFGKLDRRVSDLTIGAYKMENDKDDQLGYAYISINTTKGEQIFAKAKKRLEVVKDNVEEEIAVKCTQIHANVNIIGTKSIEEFTLNPNKKRNYRNRLASIYLGLHYSQFNLRALWQFLKFNFFTKNIKTDFDNLGVVLIAPNCRFKLSSNYKIELNGTLAIGTRRVRDSRQETRLRMEKGAKLIVNKRCSFGAGSNVEIYKDAVLEVGELISNAELTIICGENIKLGTPVNIARNAIIRDTSGHILATPGYKKTKPVIVGNHVWLCTESMVMPGVTIGDGAIAGARAFVNKKIKPFSMVLGYPAEEVGVIKYFKM